MAVELSFNGIFCIVNFLETTMVGRDNQDFSLSFVTKLLFYLNYVT